MITDHLETIRLNEVVNSLKEQNQKLLIDKQELQEKFSLYVVVSSNMRKALTTVVKGYEGDGMENMQIRDNVFYKVCKEAISLEKTVSK